LCLACLLPIAAGAEGIPGAGKESGIYLFIVSSSKSTDSSAPQLRYADDDAALFYEFFRPVAEKISLFSEFDNESQGLFPEAAQAARPPVLKDVISEFGKLAVEIKKNGAEKKTLFVILIGHGGIGDDSEGYLSLGGEKLTRRQITEMLSSLDRESVSAHVIVDACHSYYLVKGRQDWQPQDTFVNLKEDFSAFLLSKQGGADLADVGFVISTSGARETYEWDYLQAGVFSYMLRSGLLGGADINRDYKITYGELRAFMAAAAGGVKIERAKPKFYLRAPLGYDETVIVDLKKVWEERGVDLLTLKEKGRISIEDSRGVKVIDRNNGGEEGFPLLLPKTGIEYYVISDKGESRIVKSADTSGGFALLSLNASEVAKRDVISQSLHEGLFSIAFTEEFYTGYNEGFGSDKGEFVLENFGAERYKLPYMISASYTMSTALFDLPGVEHGFAVKGALPISGTLYFGPEAGATFSSNNVESGDFDLYRFYAGLYLGAAIRPWESFSLYYEAGFAPQWIVHDGAEDRSDSLSLRTRLEAGIAYVFGRFAVKAGGGLGISIITIEGSGEEFYYQPYAAVGFGYLP